MNKSEWRKQLNDNLQEEVDKDVLTGHHPFGKLAQLNVPDAQPMGEFIIFDARFATGYRKVTRMMIEELELDVIERLKPYWDLAEIHFVGRFHMRFTPRRIVVSPSYELKVSLCFYDARDFDNFKIMTKLHDMPECLELDY